MHDSDVNCRMNGVCIDAMVIADVMLGPDNDQPAGAEDPRVLYNPRDQTYYCFFTSVQVDAASGGLAAHLALATATDPSVSWTMRGLVFPQVSWSKSGALLLRDSGPHMLFWGDDSIRLASTNDILHFSDIGWCPALCSIAFRHGSFA